MAGAIWRVCASPSQATTLRSSCVDRASNKSQPLRALVSAGLHTPQWAQSADPRPLKPAWGLSDCKSPTSQPTVAGACSGHLRALPPESTVGSDMAAAATGAPTLQQVASGAAAALVQAQPLPTAAAASLRADLFPGPCCYLALAVGDSSALLLSGNLLAPAGCAHEPAGVHAASRCWAGAAIAARRPMACSLPHGGRNGDCSHLAQHTDLAAAAKRWGAGAFLCLPFHVPAADAAEASASSSPDAGSTAALLLGVETVPAGAALQLAKQQQQQQQQQQQREHVHSLLSLAGSIVQHAAPELRQAAEALALLRPHLTVPAALQLEQLESVREEELEGGDAEEEEEEEEEGGAAAAAAGGGPGDAAASPAAAAGAAGGELEAGSSRQAVTSLPPPQDLQAAGPGWQAAGPAGNIRMTSGSGARPSSSGAGPSSSNAAPGGSRGAPVGLQGDAPRVPSGTQQQQQQQQQLGGHRQPFLVRLRQVLLLCWLPLREMLALPAARRSLGLDALLRFQGPAAPSTVAFHGEQWGLPGHGQGRSLEDEFAEYHCRILADKVRWGAWMACACWCSVHAAAPTKRHNVLRLSNVALRLCRRWMPLRACCCWAC